MRFEELAAKALARHRLPRSQPDFAPNFYGLWTPGGRSVSVDVPVIGPPIAVNPFAVAHDTWLAGLTALYASPPGLFLGGSFFGEEAAEVPLEPTEHSSVPLVAWKAYQCDEPGNLYGANGFVGPGFVRWEARCGHGHEHRAPAGGCHCGFHATTDLEAVWGYHGDGSCLCEMYLAGLVIVNETGYRAEFSYPKRIIAPYKQVARRIGWRYGVPVRRAYRDKLLDAVAQGAGTFDDLWAMAKPIKEKARGDGEADHRD